MYDTKLTVDTRGKYWYDEVEPGKYFIYVKGEIQGRQLTGNSSLK
jgi:hypothetical protein